MVELPTLPSETTELHVQDNRLTSVSPGHFDRLVALKKVSLSGNPFHCDCRIQYLRSWLLRNRIRYVPAQTLWFRKPSLNSAMNTSPPVCTDSTYNTVIGVVLCFLILLLLWSLRLAKTSSFTLSICERHLGLEADSLRSLRPKHRRRLHTAPLEVTVDSLICAGELEKPLNMELLPQVQDVLHKKHTIKIKAT